LEEYTTKNPQKILDCNISHKNGTAATQPPQSPDYLKRKKGNRAGIEHYHPIIFLITPNSYAYL
jgi:hypothetical protein